MNKTYYGIKYEQVFPSEMRRCDHYLLFTIYYLLQNI